MRWPLSHVTPARTSPSVTVEGRTGARAPTSGRDRAQPEDGEEGLPGGLCAELLSACSTLLWQPRGNRYPESQAHAAQQRGRFLFHPAATAWGELAGRPGGGGCPTARPREATHCQKLPGAHGPPALKLSSARPAAVASSDGPPEARLPGRCSCAAHLPARCGVGRGPPEVPQGMDIDPSTLSPLEALPSEPSHASADSWSLPLTGLLSLGRG